MNNDEILELEMLELEILEQEVRKNLKKFSKFVEKEVEHMDSFDKLEDGSGIYSWISLKDGREALWTISPDLVSTVKVIGA